MILVADSGSTKCDWIVIDKENNYQKTHTMGFNPFFHNTDLVISKLTENELFNTIKDSVNEVYFYGAGCSSRERNEIIKKGLVAYFDQASTILVDHDLTGAAVATSQGKIGISCILGTGSNSCYFDGSTVHEEVPALGYILGDEGSGSYFGKIMLSEWLYKRMPKELADAFQKKYDLSKEGIFEAVHKKENPNVYLASFMPFVSTHIDNPYFKKMMFDGLSRFAEIHVLCYANYTEVPVNFVGSVAYYFKDMLEEVGRKYNFTVGKIEKRPVEPLAMYHYNQKQLTI
ncbi:MAG: N-acetylglucosamine kinase-like BadF-type ATPase [Paracoccaceae bacterium]|jgi:N-acetylglucosamine kinase-like BadF-type ATPase